MPSVDQSLPYRYSFTLELEIVASGVQATGAGAKATIDRLADALEADDAVVSVDRYPELSYLGFADARRARVEKAP